MFYDMSTLVGYLMPNPVYTLLYIIPMNINGYVPFLINTFDTIVMVVVGGEIY